MLGLLGDEIHQQIKLAAEQQVDNHRPVGYGHVANYDPKTSRARFIIPSFTDDGVDFVLTSWAPLHTGFNGIGWGIQAAPVGGATKQKPTAGELCIINFADRQYGVITGAHLIANQVNTPPNTTLAPGEIYIKGKGTQFTHLKADGSILTNVATEHTVATIDAKASHQVQTNGGDGYVNSKVTSIDKFKICIGGTWYNILMSALTPTSPPPA